MIDHRTVRIDAALRLWTRVHAVQVLTCLIGRTFSVDGTFWSACYIRVAKIVGYARACGCTGSGPADGVLSARRWVARIYWRRQFRTC